MNLSLSYSTQGRRALREGSANCNALGKEPALHKDPSSIPEPSDGKSNVCHDCNPGAEGVEAGNSRDPVSSRPSLFGEFQASETACFKNQGRQTPRRDA